jgi:hypothetical protein
MIRAQPLYETFYAATACIDSVAFQFVGDALIAETGQFEAQSLHKKSLWDGSVPTSGAVRRWR